MTTHVSGETNAENQIALSRKTKILFWITWGFVKFLMFIGKIKVRGIENVRKTAWENRLLLPNHPSFLEAGLIPLAAFMPAMIKDPAKNFPWQTPNENTIKNSKITFLEELPLIPLKTDEKGRPNDAMALRKIIRQLKESTFIIFPEGTRSFRADEPRIQTPSGITIGQARGGIGFLIWYARPTVIPVLVKHTDRVMPPRSPWRILWRMWFHHVEIIFGEPLDLSQFLNQKEKPTPETFNEIGKTVMAAIATLDIKQTKGDAE